MSCADALALRHERAITLRERKQNIGAEITPMSMTVDTGTSTTSRAHLVPKCTHRMILSLCLSPAGAGGRGPS